MKRNRSSRRPAPRTYAMTIPMPGVTERCSCPLCKNGFGGPDSIALVEASMPDADGRLSPEWLAAIIEEGRHAYAEVAGMPGKVVTFMENGTPNRSGAYVVDHTGKIFWESSEGRIFVASVSNAFTVAS